MTPQIDELAAVLRQGGVIAFPTETLYGLAADALNPDALEKLAAIKGRALDKQIACIAADRAQVELLTEPLSGVAERLARKFWPGPLTLVLKARPGLSPRLAASGFVGVRVSSHPLAAALAAALGHPITATSANLSGGAPAMRAVDIDPALAKSLDGILDGGATPGGPASTVAKVEGDAVAILREGAISAAELYSSVTES